MAAMNQDEVRALDRVRQRLQTFANTLGALRQDLEKSDRIPPWPILSDQIQTATRTLSSLQETLSENSAFLSRAHAYPLPSFPGRTQEGLLQQLLRKKLDPSIEDAIADAKKEAARFIDGVDGVDGEDGRGGKLGEHDLADLWLWAGPGESEIAHSIFSGPELMDEDEEGSEDEDDEAESAAATPAVRAGESGAPNLELFLRFMSTGRDPEVIARDLQREREVQRMVAGKGRSANVAGRG
ncbi:mediator of RNA polymerase II transcription subunit 8 [Coniosporium tulheliwenetii]|uniref:Mediator of RNA polymerase II transcription subunit 8 n=1 Tax=Coniosporium tulheliwenetii TaxID=3383036 RepID=A0ACC2Z8D8_9PEZI|nr:mediator of RNA polymerase II transcription subunit 8 [Cladosporium sp. JES 115]